MTDEGRGMKEKHIEQRRYEADEFVFNRVHLGFPINFDRVTT